MQLTGASRRQQARASPNYKMKKVEKKRLLPLQSVRWTNTSGCRQWLARPGPTSLCWSGPTRRRAVKATHRREVRAELQEVGPAEPGRGNWTLRAWAGGTRVTGETHRGAGTSEKGGKATLDLSKEHVAHPEVRGTVRKILAQT